MNGYNLTTIVWGEKFIKNFTEFVIPSLLAEGNIPYLSKKSNLYYQIFTYKHSINIIKNSESFKELEKYCDIIFETNSLDELKKEGKNDRYEITNLCLSKSIKNANKNSNPWVRVQPDILQAKKNFQTLHSLVEKKYRIIFYPMGLRTSKNICIELNRKHKKGNILNIENFELVYLAMKYAIKKEEYKIYNNYKPKNFQQSVFWSLGEKGYLERSINAGELVCIYPSNKEIEYNFRSISIEASDYLETAVPDQKDWVFIKNSNDFVTCGIEEGFEEGNSVFLKKQKSIFLNKPSKLAIALSNVNMNHSKMLKNSFLEHPIKYFSIKNHELKNDQWLKIEKKTRFYAAQIILISKILSFFPTINKLATGYIKFYIRFYEKIKHSRKFSKFFFN